MKDLCSSSFSIFINAHANDKAKVILVNPNRGLSMKIYKTDGNFWFFI